MTRARKALASAIAVLLLLAPMASAKPLLGTVVDDKIGEVDERLDRANSTYGERKEFQQAKAELGRASISLLNNATLLGADKLQLAVGAIETGKAREKATGSEKRIIDFADGLAQKARDKTKDVRDRLSSMERTGLEPVAFSGGLNVATLLVSADNAHSQYEIGRERWHNGQRNEGTEQILMTGAASALLAAEMADQLLVKVTEARANATATQLLSYEDLRDLAGDRVNWTQASTAAVARESRDRVLQADQKDSRIMALGAYTTFFEDLTFNGMNTQLQRDRAEVVPVQRTDELLNETWPAVDAWTELLDVPGDVPYGALNGAELYNERAKTTNQSKRYNVTASLGLSQVHLAIEHAALLQEAYGHKNHTPGKTLKPASIGPASEDGDSSLVPFPGTATIVGLIALAGVALRGRGESA